jgi:adiponectin receptor
MIPFFDRDAYYPLRFGLFGITALTNFVPIFHIYKILGTQNLVEYNLWYFYVGSLANLVCCSLYAINFPESYIQGKFDYFGASHQIMHFGTIAANLLYYYGNLKNFHTK